ncbi:hypothetical protein CEXT_293821 [Caerostris extrusa]|uniref:Uncharacterized protein n=1 Tax=Caerostris extrusa TaxID=172846 RepID=A0AAV4MDC9_CAEEX|nr:hypothetical protein CEXT_293821 [Caerostris extrusa]
MNELRNFSANSGIGSVARRSLSGDSGNSATWRLVPVILCNTPYFDSGRDNRRMGQNSSLLLHTPVPPPLIEKKDSESMASLSNKYLCGPIQTQLPLTNAVISDHPPTEHFFSSSASYNFVQKADNQWP